MKQNKCGYDNEVQIRLIRSQNAFALNSEYDRKITLSRNIINSSRRKQQFVNNQRLEIYSNDDFSSDSENS